MAWGHRLFTLGGTLEQSLKPIIALAAMLAAGCASIHTPIHDPLRTDANFRAIRPGMTEAQVTELVGKPDDSMTFPLSGNRAWAYDYYDLWGYMAEFSVTFGPDHLVLSRYSRRYTGGDASGK